MGQQLLVENKELRPAECTFSGDLTAELPLGVCRNGRALLEVGRLLIAYAPAASPSAYRVDLSLSRRI